MYQAAMTTRTADGAFDRQVRITGTSTTPPYGCSRVSEFTTPLLLPGSAEVAALAER